jgi:hypothetical protein
MFDLDSLPADAEEHLCRDAGSQFDDMRLVHGE